LFNTLADGNGSFDVQIDPFGNFFTANYLPGTSLDKLDPSGNLIGGNFLPGPGVGVAVVGIDSPAQAGLDQVDNYSFTLNAGKTATIAVTDLSGMGTVQATLIGANGVPVATSIVIDAAHQQIDSYVAHTSGTYYVQVTASEAVTLNYSLTVERNAEFYTQGNTTLAAAEQLLPDKTGKMTVVGDVGQAQLYAFTSLQTLLQPSGNFMTIELIDPQTGAVLHSFPAPGSAPFPGGVMALDGTTLYYNALSPDGNTNLIFTLNPGTGVVTGSFVAPAPFLSGLAFLDGSLYARMGPPSTNSTRRQATCWGGLPHPRATVPTAWPATRITMSSGPRAAGRSTRSTQ
jgi:hypothetical protein